MKLPVGSDERLRLKLDLEQDIIEQADKWEKLRGELSKLGIQHDWKIATSYHHTAEKLARLVRKWRRL